MTDLLSFARHVPLSAQLAGLVCLLAYIVLGLRKRTARPDIAFDLDWSDKPSIWLTGALLSSLFASVCLSIIPQLLGGLVVSTIGAVVVIYYLSRGSRAAHAASSSDIAADSPALDVASPLNAIRLDESGAFSDGGDTVRVVLGRLFDGLIDSVVVSHGGLDAVDRELTSLEAAPSRTADDERRLIDLRGAKRDWSERLRRFEAGLALFRGGGHGSGMTREWFAAYADELRFALSLARPVDRDVMAILAVRGWQSVGGLIPLAITEEERDAAMTHRQDWIADAEVQTGRPFGREGREPMVPVSILSDSFIYGRVFPHACVWLLTEVERRGGAEHTLDWPALQRRVAALPDVSPDMAMVSEWVLVLADRAHDRGILRRLTPRSFELRENLLSR